MATASVTNSFVAGTTASAAQVNQNFADLVSFINANLIQKDGSVVMTSRLTLAALDPTSADHAARKSYVDNAAGGPVGTLAAYAGSTEPTGWLFCYGQAISRTTFASLFGVISTTYGTGDGSTTFNLPDLRGRVPIARDNMGGSDAGRLTISNNLGTATGAQNHTLSAGEMPVHTHGPTGGFTLVYANLGGGNIYGGGTIGFASGANMTDAGGGAAHNNMQPSMVVNWIIKTGS